MKKALLLLSFLLVAAMTLPTAVQAQEIVEIGTDGGTSTSSYLPGYTLYDNTLSEQIYTPEEVTMAGTISSIAFYNGGSTKSPTVKLYMVNTEKTAFSSTSDWLTVTNSDLVFEGSVTFTAGEWTTIELQTPFEYDGSSNLGIVAHIHMSTYSSGLTCRVFTGTSNCSMYKYRDNTVFDPTNPGVTGTQLSVKNQIKLEITPGSGSTCEKPSTFEVSNVYAHSASFIWTSGIGNYTFEYKKASEQEWTIVSGLTAETYVLNNLDAATAYNARVKAVCGTDSESGYKTISFTTPCSTYDVPYTYGFEEAAPFDCWTPIAGAAIASGSSIAHNSTYYLKFSGTTSNMIALPQFTSATNTLRVEFWTRPESYSYSNCGKFAIGYMTDINDQNTFVAIETYNYDDWTTNTYVKKTVDLVNVPANANIAMRQFDCSSNYFWYVDDITVKEMPSCEAPTALSADASSNSAELSWTANSGETAWTVYYKKTTDETYTEVPDVYFNPYILEGLTAVTNYQYYVVANCSAADASEPSEVFTFTTECEAISAIGYSENFDNYTAATGVLPLCWSRINTGTSYATYPNVSGYNSNSTPNCLYFCTYGNENYSSISDQYAVLPEMSGLDGKQITLFAKGYNTSSTFKIGLMEDPTDVSTFRVIATQELTTSYQEFVYQLSGAGNYVAIMMPKPTGSSTVNLGVYIDDITIADAPTCLKPVSLASSDVTNHEVTLSWTNGAEGQSAWQICLNGDENNLIDANSNPFTLEGLTASTTYTAKVRANCGNDGMSDWSNEVSFTTLEACPAPVLYEVSNITGHGATVNWTGYADNYIVMLGEENITLNADFETNNFSQLNGVSVSNDASYPWVITNDAAARGTYSIRSGNYHVGSSTSTFSITVEFTEAGTISFSGRVSCETQSISNDWDYGTFLIDGTQQGTRIINSDLFTRYTYDVASGSHTFTWKYKKDGSADMYFDGFFVDDIVISMGEPSWDNGHITDAQTYTFTGLAPETSYLVKVKPVCAGIEGAESDIIQFITDVACPTPVMLTPTLFPGNDSTVIFRWEVAESVEGCWLQFSESSDFITGHVYTTGGIIPYDSLRFSHLTPETTYYARVKASCGSDGESDWSNSVSFTPTAYITIGDATSTSTSDKIPTNTYYNFSHTQQIYTPAELGEAGSITSLGFQNTTGNGTRNLDIYMVSTNMSSVSATADTLDFIPVTISDLVFSGNVNFASGDWTNITLTTPFIYDGSSNVAIIVYDKTANFISGGSKFRTYNASAYQTLYTYNDRRSYYDTTIINNFSSSTDKNLIRIKKGAIPSCIQPAGLTIIGITPHTATLAWTPRGEENAWTVSYRTGNQSWIDMEVTGSPAVVLENLAAETRYEVEVKANCGQGDYSTAATTQFNTGVACPAPVTNSFMVNDITGHTATAVWEGYTPGYEVTYRKVPYPEIAFTEDFENDDFSAKWISANVERSDAIATYYNTYSAHFTASAGSTSAGSYMVSVNPMVSDIAGDLYLSFDFRAAAGGTAPFQYGYSTTDNNLNSFTFSGVINANNTWNRYDIAVPAGVKFIAFRYVPEINSSDLYIDNISVNTYPEEQAQVAIIYTNSYEMTGLDPESIYWVTVRGYCGEEGYSHPFDTIDFMTDVACPAPYGLQLYTRTNENKYDLTWEDVNVNNTYNLQYRTAEGRNTIYEEGFEGGTLPTGWTNEGDTTWSVGKGDYSISTGTHSGSYNALIKHTVRYNESYLVTSAMDLSEYSEATLNLWYINRSYSGDIDGFGVYYRVDGGAWNELFATTTVHASWTELTIPLAGLAANYQLGFKMSDDYGYGVGIDDISISTPIAAGEWVTISDISDTLYQLSGRRDRLVPGTVYEVHVQSNCGEVDGTSLWCKSVFFTAEAATCESIFLSDETPSYTEDFENIVPDGTTLTSNWTGFSPACWTWNCLVNVPVDTMPQIYHAFATSGSYSIRMQHQGIYVMPEVEIDYGHSINEVEMSFWMRTPYKQYSLEIGIANDLSVPGAYTVIGEAVSGTSNIVKFKFDFSNYVDPTNGAGPYYIVFKNKSQWNDNYGVIYLDDITLSITPACAAINLPYSEDFDTYTIPRSNIVVEPDCWTVAHQDVANFKDRPQIYQGSAHSGNNSLRMKDRCIYAMPKIAGGNDIRDYKMSFYLRQSKNLYRLQVGVMTDLDDESTFVPVATLKTSTTSTPEYKEFDFSEYSGAMPAEGYYIAFRNTLVPGANMDYSYNYIDDIQFEIAECVTASLPYTESFETYVTSATTTETLGTEVEPDCWKLVSCVKESATTRPQIFRGYAEDGSYSLRLKNLCVYAMPKLASSVDLSNAKMEFSLRQPKSIYTLEVGVMDNLYDMSTYQRVKRFNNSTTDKQHVIVDFSTFNGDLKGKYIVFKNTLVSGANLDYSYNYIDAINLYVVGNVPGNAANGENMAAESEEYHNAPRGMEDNDMLPELNIYPNPTTGTLNLSGIAQRVEVYSQIGSLMAVYENVNQINISNLSEGIYFLRITMPEGVAVRKVVKR